jgi:WXG100 family type VII secretion target
MAVLGLDVEAARDLSRNMSSTADNFNQLMQQLSNLLSNVEWRGQDADTFRNNWQGSAMPQMNQIIEMLRESGTNLSRQADEQERVSSS